MKEGEIVVGGGGGKSVQNHMSKFIYGYWWGVGVGGSKRGIGRGEWHKIESEQS